MTLALTDCLSAGCTLAFKTFAEMAAHRLAAHQVAIEETYADVDEPMPKEALVACEPCGDPTHRPGDDPSDEDDEDDHECPWCGAPCRCPGVAAAAGSGEPLDCTHECDDDTDDTDDEP